MWLVSTHPSDRMPFLSAWAMFFGSAEGPIGQWCRRYVGIAVRGQTQPHPVGGRILVEARTIRRVVYSTGATDLMPNGGGSQWQVNHSLPGVSDLETSEWPTGIAFLPASTRRRISRSFLPARRRAHYSRNGTSRYVTPTAVLLAGRGLNSRASLATSRWSTSIVSPNGRSLERSGRASPLTRCSRPPLQGTSAPARSCKPSATAGTPRISPW